MECLRVGLGCNRHKPFRRVERGRVAKILNSWKPPQPFLLPIHSMAHYWKSTRRPTFNRQHRTFSEDEKLSGNTYFCKWAFAITTEFQVLGILDTIVPEFAGMAPWSQYTKLQTDARWVRSSNLKFEMSDQLFKCGLCRWVVRAVSSFESHKLVTQIERLIFLMPGQPSN